MWDQDEKFVYEVDDVFLAEKDAYHDIGRGGIFDVGERGRAVVLRCEYNEGNEVAHENYGKYTAVGGKEGACKYRVSVAGFGQCALEKLGMMIKRDMGG